MKNLMRGLAGVILLMAVSGAWADTVTLPLNCAGYYDVNTPAWTYNFDLGVTFGEITNVYIDWSGEITGGIEQYMDNPDHIIIDGGLQAVIGTYPQFGAAIVRAGALTYPDPQVFNVQSEYMPLTNWNFLLDGKDEIEIDHLSIKTYPEYHIIDEGSAILNNATLIVEGTIVPEPSTLILLALGLLAVQRR